jgi:hypothetical protein
MGPDVQVSAVRKRQRCLLLQKKNALFGAVKEHRGNFTFLATLYTAGGRDHRFGAQPLGWKKKVLCPGKKNYCLSIAAMKRSPTLPDNSPSSCPRCLLPFASREIAVVGGFLFQICSSFFLPAVAFLGPGRLTYSCGPLLRAFFLPL